MCNMCCYIFVTCLLHCYTLLHFCYTPVTQSLTACNRFCYIFALCYTFSTIFLLLFARYAFCHTKSPLKKWLATLLWSIPKTLWHSTWHRYLHFFITLLFFLMKIFSLNFLKTGTLILKICAPVFVSS